jgi:hypothetical protein
MPVIKNQLKAIRNIPPYETFPAETVFLILVKPYLVSLNQLHYHFSVLHTAFNVTLLPGLFSMSNKQSDGCSYAALNKPFPPIIHIVGNDGKLY